jgi:hypothetical protein
VPPSSNPGKATVVRIPIAGPKPYNTLVAVRETISTGLTTPADGNLHRTPGVFTTSFHLKDYDPTADVPYEHSTTAVIYHLSLEDDTSFLAAYDALDAAFDDSGQWIVTVDTAAYSDGEAIGSYAAVSSWILCYEPPREHPPVDYPHHIGSLPFQRAQRAAIDVGSEPLRARRRRRP